ncbi:MAG: glycolate oxidase subunit GlcE [Steroidobacteraceae bacterium]
MIETPPGRDLTNALVERVLAASNARTPLRIVGGDTKRFYGRPVAGEALALAGHHGVLRYDPAELVITARGGTTLADIEALLARHGQRLPFEPPSFGPMATLGGTVAAGLAGPARVARGPVRDHVLGARLLTGDGRVLKFGGEVMKNVAGYDVSRLLAGSLGILGVLLEVSLKVLPVARGTRTLRRHVDAQVAIGLLGAVVQNGMPITGSFWSAGELYVRLEGSSAGLDEVVPTIGGELLDESAAASLWHSVREQTHPYFVCARPLWRLSLPATAASAALLRADRVAFEWNGAQAWLSGVEREAIEPITRTAGGHATLFRRDDATDGATGEVFAPLPAPMLDLHRTVKRVFDPAGILNPGRMYADL